MWLISLYGISSWSQKLWKALTHRCLPGCLPIWPSQGLATTLHYNSREQTQGYWVGVGVGCWVGCCSFKSSDLLHIKFERQIRLTWSGIWAELRLDNQVGELSDQYRGKKIRTALQTKMHDGHLWLICNFLHLQTRCQFWLLQVGGYFNAKYPGCFINHTPFITIDRRQSLDLFNLRENEEQQSN